MIILNKTIYKDAKYINFNKWEMMFKIPLVFFPMAMLKMEYLN